jgi:hypothetical protein
VGIKAFVNTKIENNDGIKRKVRDKGSQNDPSHLLAENMSL